MRRPSKKGKFEMGDIDALTAERDRLEGELRELEGKQAVLENESRPNRWLKHSTPMTA
jgi:hypothetical protein